MGRDCVGPRLQPRTSPGSGGGPPVPATMAAFRPSSSGLTPADPSNVLVGISQSNPGTFTRFDLENPGTVSLNMDAGASVNLGQIQNLVGDDADFRLGDPCRIRIWAEDVAPPDTDVVIWGVMTRGAVSATSYGFGVSLRGDATGWRMYLLRNIGGGWLHQNSSGVSAATRGAEAHSVIGNSSNLGRTGAVALDASGLPVIGAFHNNVLNTASFNDPLDTLTIGAGYIAGTGAFTGNVGVSGLVILADAASVGDVT